MWESYSVQSLLNAATEGIGVSFLSLDHVLAYGSPDLVILNIPDFRAERYVHVCYHKDKIFTPLIQNFLDYYAPIHQGTSSRGNQALPGRTRRKHLFFSAAVRGAGRIFV